MFPLSIEALVGPDRSPVIVGGDMSVDVWTGSIASVDSSVMVAKLFLVRNLMAGSWSGTGSMALMSIDDRCPEMVVSFKATTPPEMAIEILADERVICRAAQKENNSTDISRVCRRDDLNCQTGASHV